MNWATAAAGLALLASTPQPILEIQAPGSPVRVGDLVPIEVSVIRSANKPPIAPRWLETWGAAEIREIGPVHTEPVGDGSIRSTQTLVVTFWTPGEFELPTPPFHSATALKSRGGDEDAGSQRTVLVESVLPPSEDIPPPRPPAPPVPLPWGTLFIWVAGAFGLATVGAIAALFARRYGESGKDTGEPEDSLSALERALGLLRQRQDLEGVFTDLSLHFRRFLGDGFSFQAAESTTSEIGRQLRQLEIPADLGSRTVKLLRYCDGIKFARRKTTATEAAASLDEAQAIAAATAEIISRPDGELEEQAP